MLGQATIERTLFSYAFKIIILIQLKVEKFRTI